MFIIEDIQPVCLIIGGSVEEEHFRECFRTIKNNYVRHDNRGSPYNVLDQKNTKQRYFRTIRQCVLGQAGSMLQP